MHHQCTHPNYTPPGYQEAGKTRALQAHRSRDIHIDLPQAALGASYKHIAIGNPKSPYSKTTLCYCGSNNIPFRWQCSRDICQSMADKRSHRQQTH